MLDSFFFACIYLIFIDFLLLFQGTVQQQHNQEHQTQQVQLQLNLLQQMEQK